MEFISKLFKQTVCLGLKKKIDYRLSNVQIINMHQYQYMNLKQTGVRTLVQLIAIGCKILGLMFKTSTLNE